MYSFKSRILPYPSVAIKSKYDNPTKHKNKARRKLSQISQYSAVLCENRVPFARYHFSSFLSSAPKPPKAIPMMNTIKSIAATDIPAKNPILIHLLGSCT